MKNRIIPFLPSLFFLFCRLGKEISPRYQLNIFAAGFVPNRVLISGVRWSPHLVLLVAEAATLRPKA